MNVKLGSVISDIVGMSGMAILETIAAGKTDPEKLAREATGRLKATHEQLVLALDGRYSDHFRWLLRELLESLKALNERVRELQARIRTHITPYREIVRQLCTIPGVDEITAYALIAELGVDMTVFADSAHAAVWAGLLLWQQRERG